MRQLSNAQVAYRGRQIQCPSLSHHCLPLSVGRALICLLPIEFGKGDRISFLRFHSVMWQRWKDFTDIIKISNQLSVNSQKRDYPGWVWPNQISPLKEHQEVRDSKEQILLCWLCRSKLPEDPQLQGNGFCPVSLGEDSKPRWNPGSRWHTDCYLVRPCAKGPADFWKLWDNQCVCVLSC